MEIIHKKNKLGNVIELPPLIERASKNFEEINALCEAFSNWLGNALPGDKFCYYTGQYVSGKKVAGLVARAYEKGIVTMYQSRSKTKNSYDYWVEKVTPKKKK